MASVRRLRATLTLSSHYPRAVSSTIGDVVAGYRLGWTHRWRLLSVSLPILALTLVALLALDHFLGRDHLVIINGFPAVRDHEGKVLPGAKLAVVAAAWLLALTAGTPAVRESLPMRAAILAAIRRLPVLGLGLAAVGGATVLVPAVVIPYTGATGVTALILVFGALVIGAAMAVRVLGGPVPPFLLGGIVGPLILLALAAEFRAAVPILFTVVVAAQAGILAGGEAPHGESGRSRRPWPAIAAVVVALLAPFGVAAANPVGAPTVRSHAGTPGEAAAVAWPAGRHPVIATLSGARFCDNDICDRFVAHDGGPPVREGQGSAAISADGTTVARALLTGGRGNGGPFIEHARCTRDGCREARLPVRQSATEPFGWPEMAVAVAPDQAVWFVLAMPSAKSYAVTFIRCADAGCADPRRHPAGTVRRFAADDPSVDGQRARLAIGADGRPVAAIWAAHQAAVVTCDPVTCAAPRSDRVTASEPGAVWQAPTAFPGEVTALSPGQLRANGHPMNLGGGERAPGSGALAVSGSRVYVTEAEVATPPGVHVTLGSPSEPEYWQQVLWECEGLRCRRQALDGFASRGWREMMAAAADGRVLIVRSDRILLVSPFRRA
jgi:hypothetical protein